MASPLPLQDRITAATQGATEYRVLKFKGGNGYNQRARDGINSAVSSWTVEWSGINLDELDTLQSAFDAASGVDLFSWQAFGDTVTKKWAIEKWTKVMTDTGFISVSATLQQEFDLDD